MTVPAVIDFIAVNADPIVEERAMDLNFNLEAQRATLATFIWRTRVLSLVFVCLALLSGCRICPDCEDLDYPAYGGAWQRTLRDSGRVGSLFDPGGARVSELVARDSPITSDEVERQRQAEDDSLDTDLDETDPVDMDTNNATGEGDSMDTGSEDERSGEDTLEKRELDDIELEREKELNEKSLDDIEVNIVPGQPAPPLLN